MQEQVIALVGARNLFAHHLLRLLPEREEVRKVLVIDVAPLSRRLPEGRDAHEKVRFHQLDLTLPSSDAQLASLLREEKVTTLVHLIFLAHPVRDEVWAHELESVGTMHILNACAAVRIKRLVVRSSTVVYGPSARNPSYIDESFPLSTQKEPRFITDKVDAERQFERFSEWNPHTSTMVLRFAQIVGPKSRDFVIPYLAEIVKLRVMGRDPLVQLLYEEDAVNAMMLGVLGDAEGVVNIAPEGVLPLRAVLRATKSHSLVLPRVFVKEVVNLLWAFDIRSFPPSFVDFLSYLCVADNSRAREQMGFIPRFSTREALHLYRQTEAFASASTWLEPL